MKKILSHFRSYIFKGILVSIPLVLSFLVLKFLYVAIDKKVSDWTDQFIGFRIAGLGIIFILFFLYLLGYVTNNIFGKWFLNLIEKIINRIPVIKTTYHIGKQLSSTLSLPHNQVFKRVVLLDYFRQNVWAIGFVTGEIVDKKTNGKLLKVFVPTVPNPTSGILVILQESMTIDPKWDIEQGLKMVISGGIIGPDYISDSIS